VQVAQLGNCLGPNGRLTGHTGCIGHAPHSSGPGGRASLPAGARAREGPGPMNPRRGSWTPGSLPPPPGARPPGQAPPLTEVGTNVPACKPSHLRGAAKSAPRGTGEHERRSTAAAGTSGTTA